jgi:ubiquinone/menaquinone biosynthesis C-methylase UbiE
MTENVDHKAVDSFGAEWTKYDQSALSQTELSVAFDQYFSLLDWSSVTAPDCFVMDVGCGSGRWAEFVAPRVGKLDLVDPSALALEVARQKLSAFDNCSFFQTTTQNLPGNDNSYDLVYSLGVLHHIPDTYSGIQDCIKKLKPGAPLLLYLYYRFDNRPAWFAKVWKVSDIIRKGIARLPFVLKYPLSAIIATLVYWPLARLSLVAEKSLRRNVSSWPLSYYRESPFYRMRTDSLDRFGTRLEHRFTRAEIEMMLTRAGLVNIKFRESEPFWCVIGYKPANSD